MKSKNKHLEWKYELTLDLKREDINLYRGNNIICNMYVKRDENGIMPIKIEAFVKTNEIKLKEFYNSIKTVPGIRDIEKECLDNMVRNLNKIGEPIILKEKFAWLIYPF